VGRQLAEGVPIDGIQGHIWSEDILAHPQVVKQRLDQVAALRLPIGISEFDSADPDEKVNADRLERVYRSAYNHPSVEGIMLWIFWSGNSWRGPNGGLARKDWTLNEAGTRFEALKAGWSTNTSGRTDFDGVFAFRGFHGDYAVILKAPDRLPLPRMLAVVQGEGQQIITFRVQ